MELEENLANQETEFPTEDLLSEELTEEPQDDSQSLDEALEDEQPQEDKPQSAGGQKEPGYVQTRISKAVEKALAQQREEFEAQMAPMREYMLNQEAQNLVSSGKVKDLETAKELVRYRQGQPQPVQQTGQGAQPRNAQGQFTSRQTSDPATSARIDMLQHQADRIKAAGGPDVIGEFRTNAEIRQMVIAGEMDFHDVAEEMKSRKPGRSTPAPMRSPNGASGAQNNAIESMSDEQFARFVKKVQMGGRYSIK